MIEAFLLFGERRHVRAACSRQARAATAGHSFTALASGVSESSLRCRLASVASRAAFSNGRAEVPRGSSEERLRQVCSHSWYFHRAEGRGGSSSLRVSKQRTSLRADSCSGTLTPYRDFPNSQRIAVISLHLWICACCVTRCRSGTGQRTDCHSTDGLVAPSVVALCGADPDANRSAGLHSYRVVTAHRVPPGVSRACPLPV